MEPFNPSADLSPDEPAVVIRESNRTSNLRRFQRVSIYLSCYGAGLTLAFVPRLSPPLWIPYTFIKLSAIGYLLVFQPKATTEARALRRFCGLALSASLVLGNWDAAWLSANFPVLLPFTTMLWPMWAIALSSVVGAIALVLLVFIAWRVSNGARTIAPFRETSNPFN